MSGAVWTAIPAFGGGATVARPPARGVPSKVPPVAALFWITKICATTLGETGGDQVSMTMGIGYALGTLVFAGFFAATLSAQLRSSRFHPWLYWAVILSTTMVGTTVSDYLDRTAGLGYLRGSALLVAALLTVLATWRLVRGRIHFVHMADRRDEAFYWVTILVSNTLGTALGDCVADRGLGYEGGALVFGVLLAGLLGLLWFTRLPRTVLFWAAFVLTRPLGATLGDVMTKSPAKGGLGFGTLLTSLVLAALVAGLIQISGAIGRAPPGHGGR